MIKESIIQALEGIPSEIKCCYEIECVHADLISDDDGNVICSNCFSKIHYANNSDEENILAKERFLSTHEIRGNINESHIVWIGNEKLSELMFQNFHVDPTGDFGDQYYVLLDDYEKFCVLANEKGFSEKLDYDYAGPRPITEAKESEEDYEVCLDINGKRIHPGDFISFKMYPKGTNRGTVEVSKRTTSIDNKTGKVSKALVVRDKDGTLFNMPGPSATRKILVNEDKEKEDKYEVIKHIRMPSPQQKGGLHKDKTKYDRKKDKKVDLNEAISRSLKGETVNIFCKEKNKEAFLDVQEDRRRIYCSECQMKIYDAGYISGVMLRTRFERFHDIKMNLNEAKRWSKDGFDTQLDCYNDGTGLFSEEEPKLAYLVYEEGEARIPLVTYKEDKYFCSICKMDSSDDQFESLHRFPGVLTLNELKNSIREIIVKQDDEYCLKSKKKDSEGHRKNLGCYQSRSGAENREKQVNFFKNAKKGK
jgi:hypothetical protein